MVKRPNPNEMVSKPEPSKDAVEMVGASDGTETPTPYLNPSANRDYKSVRMNFNEYEYRKLEYLAEKTHRSKMSAIRWAVVEMARKVEKNGSE